MLTELSRIRRSANQSKVHHRLRTYWISDLFSGHADMSRNSYRTMRISLNLCENSRETKENGHGERSKHEHSKLSRKQFCESALASFRLDFPTFVITDASPVGLGAILLQDQDQGERKPIAYISRSLTPTERRYSQIEREALGCVWAVERLHNYLFGLNFTLLTDNKPWSSMLDPHSSKVLPPRIQRLAWRLHQYNFQIEHVAGKVNTADSLSRLPSKSNCSSDSGIVCENHVKFVYDTNMLDLQAVTLSDMSRETRRVTHCQT